MKKTTGNEVVAMKKLLLAGLAAVFLTTGCGDAESPWSAEEVVTISGLSQPESALYEPESGLVYVSNIDCKPGENWVDDGKGYISVMGEDNIVKATPLVESTSSGVINAPKGMCVLDGFLYFTDNSRVMRCTLSGDGLEVVADGFAGANDLATDGREVWVSDGAAGKIFAISPNGEKREIQSPPGINGLTFFGEQMFGVSWATHDIYELDPAGEKAPVAFGLARHFKALDGIEVLDDGTFIVSDMVGNKVFTVSPDRSTASKLLDIPGPADIGLNRKDSLLYVPQTDKSELAVFRLKARI